MALLPLKLPTIQNWSCHNCGGCCTQHLIEITPEERQRILDQQWTAADGVEQEPVVWFAGKKSQPRYRLAHRPDGACVFLTEDGLCRIHAKFGEPAKPLACRVYPYALHPHGKSITVSLRFSCPSVVANLGKPVAQQTSDLQTIEALVVPEGAERMPPPRLSPTEHVEWPVFETFINRVLGQLSHEASPLLQRFYRVLAWTNLVATSRLDGLNRTQINEFMTLLTTALSTQSAQLPTEIDPPGKLGRLYFRLFAAQYARKDTVRNLSGGWADRWRLFRAVLRFTRGRGNLPPLQAGLHAVPFEALEGPFGELPEGTNELFTRYWQVKVQGLHCCGPAFYGLSLTEGLPFLLLMFPVTLWLARWRAVSQGRRVLTLTDVQEGLAMADHNQGYAETLGQRSARTRMKYLMESGELFRLGYWYAR